MLCHSTTCRSFETGRQLRPTAGGVQLLVFCIGSYVEHVSKIGGPLILLQLWSWEHITIGRPYIRRPRDPPQEDPEAEDEDDILGTQHQRGVDPLACRWLRVHLSCAHTASGLPYYRDVFDHQREDQMIWQPYTEAVMDRLPEICAHYAVHTMPIRPPPSTVHTMPIRPPPHRGGHSARAFRPPTPSQHTIMTSPPLVHRQYQRNRRRSNTTSGVGVGLDDIPEETAASSSSSPHGKKQHPS
ncbi:uncharacterized protein LOC110705210 [Chenopodium quinoa]|uniref:uncharacterized protein LOC110705210 n=1 Tax=Chenopodium quinoa TaxID=63459 RepID=UPI000B78C1FB|nr:uncharacterized protein LOC110705210 [Chenopodium quinoa]